MTLTKKPFEKIEGKGENTGNQHFLLSQNVFYPAKTNFNFSVTFILSSANAFSLDQSKILSFGKMVKHSFHSKSNSTTNLQSKNCLNPSLNPLPDDKILDWPKLKQIADNILKCI